MKKNLKKIQALQDKQAWLNELEDVLDMRFWSEEFEAVPNTLVPPYMADKVNALLLSDMSVWDFLWNHEHGFIIMWWLSEFCGYPRFEAPDDFTHCRGDMDLDWYGLPLPEGFARCDGHVLLKSYKHPLPSTFKSCGGDLYIGEGYDHLMPKGMYCEGDVYTAGYEFHPPKCGGRIVD